MINYFQIRISFICSVKELENIYDFDDFEFFVGLRLSNNTKNFYKIFQKRS